MIRYRARWILPIDLPPIRNGWVDVDRGCIVEVGESVASNPRTEMERDLGAVAILPGLVNAHTHLELSWMAGLVAPAPSLPQWIRDVMRLRRGAGRDGPAAMTTALDGSRGCGTAVIADISNTLASFRPLVRSGIAGVLFHEVIKFNPENPEELVGNACAALDRLPRVERVRPALAAHAVYSVAPSLFAAVATAVEHRPVRLSSVHLAESNEERTFLLTGGGPLRTLLEELDAWDENWTPPGCGPVEYLARTGFLGSHLLVVHGVHLSDRELGRLAEQGATLVTCPRSNVWTGAGAPPVSRFYASGVAVAVGTDSLASSPDLNIFAELAELRRLAPQVPPRRLLESATVAGARALQLEAHYGTIGPSRRAELIAVDVPENVTDVEEYLVSGITADRIRWVEPVVSREP